MKKSIYFISAAMITVLFAFAADAGERGAAVKEFRKEHQQIRKDYGQTQKTENKEFRKTLKGTTGEDRASAIKEHRTEQQTENKAFNEQMHDERMDFAKQQLEANPNLTDEQKADILNHREAQHDENVGMRDERQDSTQTVIQGIINNTSMTPEQKKLAVEQYIKEQKAETGKYYSNQSSENKDYRERIRNGE